MIEKRMNERQKVSMQLTISTLFRQNNIEVVNVEAPIEVINISKTGLAFKTDSILPLDYYFNAKLQFGNDENSILYSIIKIIRATLPVSEDDETTIYGFRKGTEEPEHFDCHSTFDCPWGGAWRIQCSCYTGY